MLLSYLSEEVYILLRDLCTPNKPNTKSYKELCGILSKHYSPQIFLYKERNEFYAAKRESDESASEWVARIKKISMNCSFGEALENILSDKFITGYPGGKIAKRIYEESEEITLEKALGIAVKYECRDMGRDVNANYTKRQNGGKPKHHSNSSNEWRNVAERRNQNGGESHDRTKRPKEECVSCGSWRHRSEECKYRTYICNNCEKKGHLAHVCKQRKQQQQHHYIESSDAEPNELNDELREVSLYKLNLNFF